MFAIPSRIFLVFVFLCSICVQSFADMLSAPGSERLTSNIKADMTYTLKLFVPPEIKAQEGRAGLLPSGVKEVLAWAKTMKYNVEIKVGSGAGKYSNASDAEYKKAGAVIVTGKENIEKAYREADIIVKVKEPLATGAIERNEFELMRAGQVWITYFHLASSKSLTKKLMEKEIVALALETILNDDPGMPGFPCLEPMSIAAGRESILYALLFRASEIKDGKIIIDEAVRKDIFGSFSEEIKSSKAEFDVPGVKNLSEENMVDWGGGISGCAAVDKALLCGIRKVTIIEKMEKKRDFLKEKYKEEIASERVKIIEDKDIKNILECLKESRIIVTATYMQGDSPEKVLTKDILTALYEYDQIVEINKPRIIIPIDIDQGGAVEYVNDKGETVELEASYHSAPAYLDYYGNIICPVANLPGMPYLVSPITSKWLQDARLPYLKALIAGMYGHTDNFSAIREGLKQVIKDKPGMKPGINIMLGDLTEEHVAAKIKNITYTPIDLSL